MADFLSHFFAGKNVNLSHSFDPVRLIPMTVTQLGYVHLPVAAFNHFHISLLLAPSFKILEKILTYNYMVYLMWRFLPI